MNYIMADETKQQRINSGVRWIANCVFGMCSDDSVKYVKAYDKLLARFTLDYGYSLSERLKSSKTKEKTVYDVLYGDELEMLLQSLYRLENMYVEVMEKKNDKRKDVCYAGI